MKLMLVALLMLNNIFGKYQCDTYITEHGHKLEIAYISHGSLAMRYDDKTVIYIDPASEIADYNKAPGADYVIVTHGHSDHFDMKAFNAVAKKSTQVICTKEVAEIIGTQCSKVAVLKNGEGTCNIDFCLEAVPAHNHPQNAKFHPAGRDNGYVLDFDGFKVYVAGDTEDIEELKTLKKENIDVAFLPVNQPYTMTVEQAVNAAKMVSPKIFIPYHYGGTDKTTDIDRLARLLKDSGIEVRIRQLQ